MKATLMNMSDILRVKLQYKISTLNSNLAICFNCINYTSVSCNGNSDVYLTPPSNSGNYIPVLARPRSTWNTIPILYFSNESKAYILHAKGSDTQSYDVTWILSLH